MTTTRARLTGFKPVPQGAGRHGRADGFRTRSASERLADRFIRPVSNRSHRRYLLGLVLISAAAVPAAAQRNSLFGGSRSRAVGTVPTTQPAGSIRQGELGARASLQAERVEPRPNATLLRLSPFAVAKPEPQKIKVHDLITIIIRESKTATTDSKMQSKKDWKLDAELSKWLRLSDKHGVVPAGFEAGNPSVVFDLKNDYGGDGKYDRKDELTTRVTARVADVKPNGNLVLEATKQITIDDEGYTITLTGECRGQDVNPDNTILSTQIAGPEINVQHTGTVRDATRRGWLMRALDLLRPF